MTHTGEIGLSIESRLENVRLAGVAVRSVCRYLGCGEETALSIELGLVEAVNNVIIHSYNGAPGHRVDLAVRSKADDIIITVTDRGRGMDRYRKPELKTDVDHVADLPEGGYGWYLIHKIMDRVDYAAEDGVNTLTMIKKGPLSP